MEVQVGQAQTEHKIGLWQALGGVITSPGTTFEKLAQVPMTWKPSLLLVLIAAVFSVPFYSKFFEYSSLVVKKTLNTSQIPAGTDVNQMLNTGATVATISALVGTVLSIFLVPIVVAGLLKLLNFVMGEEAKFSQLWTVTIFSRVPALLGLLLGNLLLLTASGDNLVTTFMLKTSLANLVPISAVPPYLFMLLVNLDLFSLWGIALTVIGTAKVFRVKAAKVGVVVFGLWLVYVLISSYAGQATMVKLLS
ncbi:MAG TPA: YIP1 family protein [Candidatus Deferrimicrobium sp.]|nr:YIP1 family protein [Candidatus Deferrimicrobium sp.]